MIRNIKFTDSSAEEYMGDVYEKLAEVIEKMDEKKN